MEIIGSIINKDVLTLLEHYEGWRSSLNMNTYLGSYETILIYITWFYFYFYLNYLIENSNFNLLSNTQEMIADGD